MALKTGALIIAADNKKREKPIYMCEALSLPLISYVKSYAEKADAEKTAIIIESDSSGVEAIKGDSRVFRRMPKMTAIFCLQPTALQTNLTMYMFSMEMYRL